MLQIHAEVQLWIQSHPEIELTSDVAPTVQAPNAVGAGNQGNDGAFSSFAPQNRTWTLAPDNVPVTIQVTAIYDLPFGRNQRFLNSGGVSN
jgi:hypothetical protein